MHRAISRLFNTFWSRFMSKRNYSTQMDAQIVCILGSTGTGKSKLGIEIAREIGGEIISADSMQVYNALDIATNKVTYAEQKLVPHHLLGVAEPWQQFTVVDFRNRVLPIVEDLLRRNKSVVIVGGTYYYVESILWKTLVSEEDEADTLLFYKDPVFMKRVTTEHQDQLIEETDTKFNSVYQPDIDSVSNRTLHKHLLKIDEESAKRIHFNERRKILRAIQIYEKDGVKLSDILKSQHDQDGGCSVSGPLRFENVKILWLQCDGEVLNERLDGRVDEMMRSGLVDELMSFHRRYKKVLPYTSGVYQAMGLKEFHDFLELDRVDTPEAHDLLQEGIKSLKHVTSIYSRKQIKFIKNRFLRKDKRQVPPIYALDTSNPDLWDENVFKPALKIVTNNLENTDIQPLAKMEPLNQIIDTFHCPECDITVIGDAQWQSHIKSNRHKKCLYGIKKREKQMQYKNKV